MKGNTLGLVDQKRQTDTSLPRASGQPDSAVCSAQAELGAMDAIESDIDDKDTTVGDKSGNLARIYNPFGDTEFLESDIDHSNRRLEHERHGFLL